MESRTISVLGLRTRVLVDGARAEGDAVVAIHGVGGWAENWSAVTAPLAATGRPVGRLRPRGRARPRGRVDAPRVLAPGHDALRAASVPALRGPRIGAVALL